MLLGIANYLELFIYQPYVRVIPLCEHLAKTEGMPKLRKGDALKLYSSLESLWGLRQGIRKEAEGVVKSILN